MLFKRGAPEVENVFPEPTSEWKVGTPASS